MPPVAPVEDPGAGWRQISGSCGIGPADRAYCWEWDSRSDVLPPSPILAARSFRWVGGSRWEGCALQTDGVASCWGPNLLGGNRLPPLESCGGPWRLPCENTPTPVTSRETRFSTLAIGDEHACGIALDGVAHCWGRADVGRLGETAAEVCPTGDRAPCSLVVRVEGERRFTRITAGGAHTCALDVVGRAHCWGAGAYGQLGRAVDTTCPLESTTTPCSAQPVAVEGAPPFTEITAGAVHSCGLTRGGSAFCWGSNAQGQLGTEVPLPTCLFGHIGTPCSPVPVPVAGDLRFVSLSAANANTCGITRSGDTYCWGEGLRGQLGQGILERVSPYGERRTPVRVLGNQRFTEISTAGPCARTARGELFCWGITSPAREIAAPSRLPGPPSRRYLLSYEPRPITSGARPQTSVTFGAGELRVTGSAGARCANHAFHPAFRRDGEKLELWLVGRRWRGGGCEETDQMFEYEALLGDLEPGRYTLLLIVHYAEDAERLRPESLGPVEVVVR